MSPGDEHSASAVEAEPTISCRVTGPLLSTLESHGIALDPWLEPLGLTRDHLSDPERRIGIRAWYGLLDAALDVTGDATLGLRGAELMVARTGQLGLVEFLAQSSGNVATAISSIVRFGRVVQDDLRFELFLEGELGRFRVSSRSPLRMPAIWAESILAYCCLAMRSFGRYPGGVSSGNLGVRFAHPAPSDTTAHQQLFKAPLTFDAEHYEIVLAPRLLATALITAQPELHGILQGYAQTLVEQTSCAEEDIRERVRSILLKDFDEGPPSKHRVAKVLHLSSRTLCRRLAEAGTTFQGLLDEARRELSLRYLRDTRWSVSEVGLALGFSGVSTFTRAFRRWTGRSPTEFRAAPEPTRSDASPTSAAK